MVPTKSQDQGNNVVQMSNLEKQLHDQKEEIAKLQASVAQLKTQQIQNKSVANTKPNIYFCCSKCGRGHFYSKESLDNHMKALHFENYFEKSLCGEKAYNLKTKNYDCGLCERSYRTLYDLKQHIRASH